MGLLVHPDFPYYAASMDYWVVNTTKSEAFILEVKAPKREPDDLPLEAECQVVMQLAIAVRSELVDWLGSDPKAVVVAGMNGNLAFWDVPWDAESQDMWFKQLLPAAQLFYLEGVLPKLLENEEFKTLVAEAAANRAPTPPPERVLPTPDDSITMTTPTFAVGKVVQRLNSNEQAKIIDVNRIKGILLDNKKRKRHADPENYVVVPLSADLCLAPSTNGQRVMVVGGSYLRNPPLEGFVDSWGPQKSQLTLDLGQKVSVNNKHLHVNEKGAKPIKLSVLPMPENKVVKIFADKYDDFLSQLLDGFQLDWVLKRPSSKIKKDSDFAAAAAAAAAIESKERNKTMEDEAAEALLNLESL